jgi:hypothetical protein
VLLQKDEEGVERVIAYGSRSCNPAESRSTAALKGSCWRRSILMCSNISNFFEMQFQTLKEAMAASADHWESVVELVFCKSQRQSGLPYHILKLLKAKKKIERHCPTATLQCPRRRARLGSHGCLPYLPFPLKEIYLFQTNVD